MGIKVDCGLKFENYLDGVIKKASNKINALSRVTPFMNLSKKKMLMNSFFKLQFSYCPQVWMCHSRTVNKKINNLHERCLRVIYNDKISWKEMGLFQYTIGIFRYLLLRCSKFITVQLHRYLRRFIINEIQTTSYATLRIFQFHLLEMYIMKLRKPIVFRS